MNFQHVPPQSPYHLPPFQPMFYPQYPPGIPHPQGIPAQPTPYALPNYHPPPGLPPHPQPPVQTLPPPPARPLRTDNGWYVPQAPPPPNGNVVYQTSRGGTPNDSKDSERLYIHPYWRGRLAPLPGSRSPPDTFSPRKENKPLFHAIEIKSASNTDSTSSRQLLASSSSGTSVTTRSSIPSSPLNEQNPKISEHERLDKYADVFIPQYLKDIQKQAQNFVPLEPISLFPSPSYLKTFLPASIIDHVLKLYPSTLLSLPPPSRSFSSSPTPSSPSSRKDNPVSSPEINFSPLITSEYYNHWRSLLSWELDEMAKEKEKIVLYQMNVSVLNWDRSEFAVCVVGIRENHPRVDIGDIMHLREVLVEWRRGSGTAFEGRITMLRKREGFIHFCCPQLRQHIQTYIPLAPGQQIRDDLPVFGPDDTLPLFFNISFLTNARPSLLMERAVATLGAALSTVNGKRNLADRWLFPGKTDMEDTQTKPIPSTPPMFGEFWVDGGLNAEQRAAATSIALYQSPVPYLISGPPGTGKTRTIVETVHQILRVQPEACILLCAPSNPATDTLAVRLGKVLKPHEMLRLNDENRTFAEVPDVIRQFCYIDNDKFALPPWKQLMRYRVIITSCLDASILVAAHCTNATLAMLEEHTMDSIHPHHMMKHQIVPHWTHLLIDEAAQGSEPELLIPISVVLTRPELLEKEQETKQHARRASVSFNYHPLALTPQLVLCGDPNQLGPIIASDEARARELDVSLLERLFESPLYAEHSEARSRLAMSELQSPNGFSKPFKPFANLVKNYRSHPAILMPPSAMFYNDSLEPFATNGYISWSNLLNPKFPLMFVGCDGKEEDVSERATWYNPGEIACVVELITSMMKDAGKCSPLLTPDQIGVMAPWREQVWKMREALRKVGLGAVDVGSVEDYQGREKRVVIISCVRSSARFLKEDGEKGIGLVFEKKRMNVAITRAKELLVVVGNGDLLKKDPYWKGFLQFALRNSLYIGPKLELELDGAWISRLESQILQAQEETGLLGTEYSEDRNTMMLAGGVAREVLRED
ncbi:adenylosuccinase ade13 [Stygiomarasmius scandens]|uniref:Adenylosuccinase ade13 n=1 Tax=Marasmiellus scandens TaxID=2682957 RepID=A0ABR1JH23_9AGAR